MENNWKEILDKIANKHKSGISKHTIYKYTIGDMLEFGSLVFEATKKECADKAKIKEIVSQGNLYGIYKPSILNIEKPNL